MTLLPIIVERTWHRKAKPDLVIIFDTSAKDLRWDGAHGLAIHNPRQDVGDAAERTRVPHFRERDAERP